MKRKLAALLAALALFMLSAQALAASEPEPPAPFAPVAEELEIPEEEPVMTATVPDKDEADHR